MHQALFTLVKNAFEAMGGQGRLRLGTQRLEGGAAVTVEDTGRGMEPDELARLFEVRFAAKRGRVRAGMGLAMARSIVERHGGRIEVESEPGRGTRFEIFLRDKGQGTGDKG